ncbi:hypothetical protein [Psychrobacter sp. LV10R520-6]|uniref:hypothetical protein n=1 Tax=Psychrobacter sp. LV10R520-6 TaxID=1415574 RepID=UPI002AA0E23A|nr:hypothetical protein [Psychrobacter sp. LV10R520-6]
MTTMQRYGVSSAFNLSRLNPVTDRVSPHNGVDLATPTGTPILNTGLGRMTRVSNHP